MSPEIIAIILFVIAAVFGLYVLIHILKDQPTPKAAVFTHGPIAAVALIILLYQIYLGNMDTLLVASVILFVIAALGGLTLFTIDMRNKPIPKALALLHPLLAVCGLVVLIVYVLR